MTSRTEATSKIAKLISLATNAGAAEAEARTAALLACKMMIQHGVAPGSTVADAGNAWELADARNALIRMRAKLEETVFAFNSVAKRESETDGKMRTERTARVKAEDALEDERARCAALAAEIAAIRMGAHAPEAPEAPKAPKAKKAPKAAPAPQAAPARRPYRGAPRIITARFPGVCVCCEKKIHAGEVISYDGNATHLACAPEAEEAAAE